jgi:hypothetical protein
MRARCNAMMMRARTSLGDVWEGPPLIALDNELVLTIKKKKEKRWNVERWNNT